MVHIVFCTDEGKIQSGGVCLNLLKYAELNESILGNKSSVILKEFEDNIERLFNLPCYKIKWTSDDISQIMLKLNADILITFGFGWKRDVFNIPDRKWKLCVNVRGRVCEPWGDVFAYSCEWLSDFCSSKKLPWVSSIINMDNTNEKLSYNGKLIIGRYGSRGSFDIPWVKECVQEIAENYRDIIFLFMNTEQFCEETDNIKFLEGTNDNVVKTKFVNTCDIMLHARSYGESFGAAPGEFSIKNKPVLTYNGSMERSHINILGKLGQVYNNKIELKNLIMYFYNKGTEGNWLAYQKHNDYDFIMNEFKKVFIDDNKITYQLPFYSQYLNDLFNFISDRPLFGTIDYKDFSILHLGEEDSLGAWLKRHFTENNNNVNKVNLIYINDIKLNHYLNKYLGTNTKVIINNNNKLQFGMI